MRETDREDRTGLSGLDPYAADGDTGGIARGREDVGQLMNSEIKPPVCRSCPDKGEDNTVRAVTGKARTSAGLEFTNSSVRPGVVGQPISRPCFAALAV